MLISWLYEEHNTEQGKPEYRIVCFDSGDCADTATLKCIVWKCLDFFVCHEETTGNSCRHKFSADEIGKDGSGNIRERCLRCPHFIKTKEVFLPTLGRNGRRGIFLSIPTACIPKREWQTMAMNFVDVSRCPEFQGNNNPFERMKEVS